MERVEKQTAVEWLAEQFEESHSYINDIFKETIEQAKKMEQKAIIEAHKQSSIESGFEDSAEDWANDYWERNYGV